MFSSAASNSKNERQARAQRGKNLLKFGVQYLDDALLGIARNDLVLIGAPSGVGKTGLCCNIALANMADGKKVHYIALEAEQFEIESRLKFQIVANMFFGDENRPKLQRRLSFDAWYAGRFEEELSEYEDRAQVFFENAYNDLFVFYKRDAFDIHNFIETVIYCAQETDLIIVDHCHFFDFDDDNENRALKELAKTARTLALENGKPIILVAHLRKRDRNNAELCAGLDEFHGSSDLTKIATKVITIAPGRPVSNSDFETFFRIPKSRTNGSCSRFLGRMIYSSEQGAYEKTYKIGWAEQIRGREFEEVVREAIPDWATNNTNSIGGDFTTNISRQPSLRPVERRKGFNRAMPEDD